MSDDIQFPMDPNDPAIKAWGEPFALNKQMVQAQASVRNDSNLTLEKIEERIYGELCYRLTSYVLEEQLVEKTHSADVTATAHAWCSATAAVEFPKTWWQHFKQDRFPKSWLRRWPVETTILAVTEEGTAENSHTETVSITFSQYAQFPAAQIQTPRNIRGSVIVAREELTSTTWPKELT